MFVCPHHRLLSSNVGTSKDYMVYEQPGTFYTALADFLNNDSHALFESDVIYDNDGLLKVRQS